MTKKLTIRSSWGVVVTIRRRAIQRRKLVYIICTPRPQRYRDGRSRIIYIGTTKQGVRRMAASAAAKAVDFLTNHGVKSLDVHLITCHPLPGVASWVKLERDLLITFRKEYGSQPKGNKTGKNFGRKKLSGLFHKNRLFDVIADFG